MDKFAKCVVKAGYFYVFIIIIFLIIIFIW